LKVSIEEISTCQKVLTIEVPSDKITAEVEDLYKEIAKTATHPGFRKGKVPRKILEAKHGNSIRQEAINGAISSSAKDALEEHKLIPLTEPELGEVNDDGEGPLSFKVTIEVKPSVKLSEYTGIELKRVKKEVTDDDVAQVLERLQHSHAKYSPADRPIEMGDFIVFDFQAFEDGKPMGDGKGENFSLEVGSGYFGEDFETQVVGMSKDDEKRIKVKYPDDYKSEELAGKELEFDVTIKDVKLRELPELDDDFAKDLGEHDTLEELKQNCKERLEKDLEKRIENSLREQAIAKIVAESEVEIPPRLKEKVAASVFEDQVRNLAQYGTDRETITAQRDQIAEFADKDAERQLKVSFLTDEIAKREDLSISDEELEKNLEEMANESGDKGADLREYFKQEKIRERYREQLRAKKILDFIVSGAKIEEVDEADAELESAESEQPEKDKEGES
jgi:trigger factor